MATISIADNDARVQYTQAVVANTTQLTIDFPFFSLDDINVIVTSAAGVDTTLTRGTGTGTFAVTGTSVDDGYSGGYVTLGDSYADASTKYTIFRDIDVERTTDFPTSGPFNISSLNTELDKIFAINQELETKIGRTLKLSDSDTSAELSLPNLDARKGTVLAFNTTTGLPEAGPEIGDVSSIAAITADISTLADIEDGTDATDAIQTVAGISSNVTTVAGISSNVSTVAGISSDVSAVASDATDIGIVSTNIASVNTVASNITEVIAVANDLNEAVSEVETVANDLNEAVSEIETVAASISNVDTVGTNIANVNTVAGNNTNINTVAGISANVTTVAGISGNVTTVAGISSDVTAVAADATDIGTVSSNIANVNTVAGIDSNVTTVAGISANVTTVSGISSNVTTVAGISSDVTTVAGQISPTNNVGTVAGIASDVSTVSGISANVTTVAGNTTNINTVAGISANVTTVAGISSDVTAVAADATDIGTVATNLAGTDTIGTVATNISNVNTVAGISANVTTVAGISSDVTAVAADATDIGTVATNIANVNSVGGSISNVNTVATNISSVNDFADKYRIGASDPTTDNDEGDLFYNTTTDTLKVYTGTAWEQGVTAGSGFLPTTGGSLTGDVSFGDNDKAIFGAGSDLQIYHDGLNSYIYENGSGSLRVRATEFDVQQLSNGNSVIKSDGSSAQLLENGTLRLETTSSGIDVTGTVTADDNITLEGASTPRVTLTDTTNTAQAFLEAGNTVARVGSLSNHSFEIRANNDLAIEVKNNGDVTFFGDDEVTQGLRWDASTQRLGLGTTSPARQLHLQSSSGGGMLSVEKTSATTSAFVVAADSGKVNLFARDTNSGTGNVDFGFNTGNTRRMTITSGGNVGIGTASPDTALHVKSSNDTVAVIESGDATAKIQIKDNSSNFGASLAVTNEDFFVQVNGSERMRIDNAGNVGIGKTPTSKMLEIYKGSNPGIRIQNSTTGTTNSDGFLLEQNGSNTLLVNYESGYQAFYTGGSERMRIDSSGNLLIGKTTATGGSAVVGIDLRPGGILNVARDGSRPVIFNRKTSTGQLVELKYNDTTVGSIDVNGSGTTYNTTSDIRLKTDIAPIADATDKLMAMNAVSHKWKSDPDADAVVGFIAQEMAEIVPEAVSKGEGEDDMWSMDYGRITPVLVAALQDAVNEIKTLKERVAELEAK